MCSSSSLFGASAGNAAYTWPMSAQRPPAPHSKTIASSARMTWLAGNPRLTAKPNRWCPRAGGKTVLSAFT